MVINRFFITPVVKYNAAHAEPRIIMIGFVLKFMAT